MTGGEIALRVLIEQGVRCGFGIPGALNAHLYDALPNVAGEFRHYLVRHELGGAWMADGYARASNDVGVAFTVQRKQRGSRLGVFANHARMMGHAVEAVTELGLKKAAFFFDHNDLF